MPNLSFPPEDTTANKDFCDEKTKIGPLCVPRGVKPPFIEEETSLFIEAMDRDVSGDEAFEDFLVGMAIGISYSTGDDGPSRGEGIEKSLRTRGL